MVPRTFPSTYQTANGETRMVVFFLSSVSGLRKWVDYIPVKFTMLETQVNNSYNNNGVILVDPLSSTTNRQAWVDYVPVFVDANDTAAWRVDANGFIPVGFSTKPTLNLDFAGTKTLDSRVTFTRASNATYFDANGVLQTASNDVARFDHNPTTLQSLGLLIEEQRTNSLPNNTMQGVVAGNPGTPPTGWTVTGLSNSIVRTIVGTGTENGITYIDLNYAGTASGDGNITIISSSTTAITASTGQTWTGSVYLRIVGGSLSNLSTPQILLGGRSSAGSLLEGSSVSLSSLTSAPLNSQRFIATRTLTNASTERVTITVFNATYVNGAAIDITLRIGLPQLELGAFATSVIPTTVAAATRNADVATMTGTNFSSWYNATEGTLYAESATNVPLSLFSGAVQPAIVSLDDGTNNNRISMFYAENSGNKAIFFRIVANGTAYNPLPLNTSSTFTKSILSYIAQTNGGNGSVNGSAASTSSPVILPVVTQFRIGTATTGQRSEYIKKIAYYPVRLSNDQLQALTR